MPRAWFRHCPVPFPPLCTPYEYKYDILACRGKRNGDVLMLFWRRRKISLVFISHITFSSPVWHKSSFISWFLSPTWRLSYLSQGTPGALPRSIYTPKKRIVFQLIDGTGSPRSKQDFSTGTFVAVYEKPGAQLLDNLDDSRVFRLGKKLLFVPTPTAHLNLYPPDDVISSYKW